MDAPKLTEAQAEALKLIRQNGRYGVGPYGGIATPTAEALERAGLIRFEYERRSGRVMQFAYPV